jgi:predicted ATPase
MRITNLGVHNFRSLIDVDIPLHDLTVVIGPNGSGKTALLETLMLLHRGSQGELARFFEERGGYQAIVSQGGGRSGMPQMTLVLTVSDENPSLESQQTGYSIELRGTVIGYEVSREMLALPRTQEKYRTGFDYSTDKTVRSEAHKSLLAELGVTELVVAEPVLAQLSINRLRRGGGPGFRRFLEGFRFYAALDVTARAPIRLPQSLTPAESPGASGESLYSSLYNLRTNQPETYDRVLAILMQAFPGLKRLEFPVVGAGMVTLAWYDRSNPQPFYPNQLSEGTLRFLWLVMLLMSPNRSSVLLIDEPEISLHPELLRLLAILLQEASLQGQVVVATHSSDLISWLQPDEVLVADKEDGQTRFTWASALNLQNWLAEYTLRDLWLMGNLGGRP